MAQPPFASTAHIPVMLAEVLEALAPRDGGIYLDGTFGAGGYSHALLLAGSTIVYGIDRDPAAIRGGELLLAGFPGRLTLIEGRFAAMEELLARHGVAALDGVALDVGVSSMQIDEAERGFSFLRDGPLDMRMEQRGASAADVVNHCDEADLTRIIGVLGEERRARAIAAAIARARLAAPSLTTRGLAAIVERVLGISHKPGAIHPATRTFQALRIHVNGELEELSQALSAAERLLKPGGRLAVVSFHSLEDRIVKRFLTARGQPQRQVSRHLPAADAAPARSFELLFKGHAEATAAECAANPRARSAKLRAGRRTAAAAHPYDPALSPHTGAA